MGSGSSKSNSEIIPNEKVQQKDSSGEVNVVANGNPDRNEKSSLHELDSCRELQSGISDQQPEHKIKSSVGDLGCKSRESVKGNNDSQDSESSGRSCAEPEPPE